MLVQHANSLGRQRAKLLTHSRHQVMRQGVDVGGQTGQGRAGLLRRCLLRTTSLGRGQLRRVMHVLRHRHSNLRWFLLWNSKPAAAFFSRGPGKPVFRNLLRAAADKSVRMMPGRIIAARANAECNDHAFIMFYLCGALHFRSAWRMTSQL